MRVLAGAIIILAATILGAAAVIRSGLPSQHDYDLVPMSTYLAFGIGFGGLALILINWRDGDGARH
jgi:hypothetical protein